MIAINAKIYSLLHYRYVSVMIRWH